MFNLNFNSQLPLWNSMGISPRVQQYTGNSQGLGIPQGWGHHQGIGQGYGQGSFPGFVFPPPPPGPDMKTLLAEADTDQNGAISQNEFLAFTPPAPPPPPGFEGQQLPAPPAPTDEMKQQMFARLDTNGDSSISQEELASAPPPPPPPGGPIGMMGPRGPRGLGHGPRGFGGMHGPPPPPPPLSFDNADTDKDGNVSQAEFIAYNPTATVDAKGNPLPTPPAPTDEMKQALFGKLDTDGNGSLSKAEIEAAPPPPPPPPFQNGFGFNGMGFNQGYPTNTLGITNTTGNGYGLQNLFSSLQNGGSLDLSSLISQLQTYLSSISSIQ